MATDQTAKSENVTANRMADEASVHVADTVQQVIDEVADTHSGRDVDEVRDAVQENWTSKVGDAGPALPDPLAADYAQHISKGNNVKVIPGHPGDS
jgi:hypothetical protein